MRQQPNGDSHQVNRVSELPKTQYTPCMWAHVLDYRRTLTTCMTAERQPRLDRRGTKSAQWQRCSSIASKSYQAAPTTRTVFYAQLGKTQVTYQRSHTAPASRAAERAEGETKQIWQVSSTFCWECCRATSPPPPPSPPPRPPLAVSRCCETGADNFRFLHSEWHVNKSAHQSQRSSVARQHSVSPVTQNHTNYWNILY